MRIVLLLTHCEVEETSQWLYDCQTFSFVLTIYKHAGQTWRYHHSKAVDVLWWRNQKNKRCLATVGDVVTRAISGLIPDAIQNLLRRLYCGQIPFGKPPITKGRTKLEARELSRVSFDRLQSSEGRNFIRGPRRNSREILSTFISVLSGSVRRSLHAPSFLPTRPLRVKNETWGKGGGQPRWKHFETIFNQQRRWLGRIDTVHCTGPRKPRMCG